MWDAKYGKMLRSFTLAPDPQKRPHIHKLVVSPGFRTLYSCGWQDRSGEVHVWDFETGQLQGTLKGHKGFIQALAISPDGRHLVTGGNERKVWIWDLEKEKILHTLKGQKSWIESLVVSPDGRHLISGGGALEGKIYVWDLEKRKRRHTLVHDEEKQLPIFAVAVTPDSRYLISGGQNAYVMLWELDSGEILSGRTHTSTGWKQFYRGHQRMIHALAVTPDGRHVISGADDKRVIVWHLSYKVEKERIENISNCPTCGEVLQLGEIDFPVYEVKYEPERFKSIYQCRNCGTIIREVP